MRKCDFGVTATPNVFSLQDAGLTNVSLYAKSLQGANRSR